MGEFTKKDKISVLKNQKIESNIEENSFFSEELCWWVTITPEKTKNCAFLLKFPSQAFIFFSTLMSFSTISSATVHTLKKEVKNFSIINCQNYSTKTFFTFSIDIEKTKNTKMLINFEESIIKPFLISQLRKPFIQVDSSLFSQKLSELEKQKKISSRILIDIFDIKNNRSLSDRLTQKLKNPGPFIVVQNTNGKNLVLRISITLYNKLLKLKGKFPKKSLSDLLSMLFKVVTLIFGLILTFILIKMLIYKDYQSKVIELYLDPAFKKVENIFEQLLPQWYVNERDYRKGLILLMRHLKKILMDMNRMHDVADTYPFNEDPQSYLFQILLNNYYSNMNNHILYLQEFANIP